MRSFITLLTAFALFVPHPLEAKSAYEEVSEVLEKRDDAYAANFVRRFTEANEAVREFLAAQAASPSEEEWVRLYKASMEKVHEASIARGQGITLVEFREFFEDRPSASRTELWMQERLASVQSKQRHLDALYRDFKRLPDNAPTSDVIKATRAWAEAHGALLGEVAELELLDANLRTYFTARGREKMRKNSIFASLLGGIANGLRQQQEAAPLINSPKTIQCNEYFSGTVCRGN